MKQLKVWDLFFWKMIKEDFILLFLVLKNQLTKEKKCYIILLVLKNQGGILSGKYRKVRAKNIMGFK